MSELEYITNVKVARRGLHVGRLRLPKFRKLAHSGVIVTTNKDNQYLLEFMADNTVHQTQIKDRITYHEKSQYKDHTQAHIVTDRGIDKWTVQKIGEQPQVRISVDEAIAHMRSRPYNLGFLDLFLPTDKKYTCHESQESLRKNVLKSRRVNIDPEFEQRFTDHLSPQKSALETLFEDLPKSEELTPEVRSQVTHMVTDPRLTEFLQMQKARWDDEEAMKKLAESRAKFDGTIDFVNRLGNLVGGKTGKTISTVATVSSKAFNLMGKARQMKLAKSLPKCIPYLNTALKVFDFLNTIFSRRKRGQQVDPVYEQLQHISNQITELHKTVIEGFNLLSEQMHEHFKVLFEGIQDAFQQLTKYVDQSLNSQTAINIRLLEPLHGKLDLMSIQINSGLRDIVIESLTRASNYVTCCGQQPSLYLNTSADAQIMVTNLKTLYIDWIQLDSYQNRDVLTGSACDDTVLLNQLMQSKIRAGGHVSQSDMESISYTLVHHLISTQVSADRMKYWKMHVNIWNYAVNTFLTGLNYLLASSYRNMTKPLHPILDAIAEISGNILIERHEFATNSVLLEKLMNNYQTSVNELMVISNGLMKDIINQPFETFYNDQSQNFNPQVFNQPVHKNFPNQTMRVSHWHWTSHVWYSTNYPIRHDANITLSELLGTPLNSHSDSNHSQYLYKKLFNTMHFFENQNYGKISCSFNNIIIEPGVTCCGLTGVFNAGSHKTKSLPCTIKIQVTFMSQVGKGNFTFEMDFKGHLGFCETSVYTGYISSVHHQQWQLMTVFNHEVPVKVLEDHYLLYTQTERAKLVSSLDGSRGVSNVGAPSLNPEWVKKADDCDHTAMLLISYCILAHNNTTVLEAELLTRTQQDRYLRKFASAEGYCKDIFPNTQLPNLSSSSSPFESALQKLLKHHQLSSQIVLTDLSQMPDLTSSSETTDPEVIYKSAFLTASKDVKSKLVDLMISKPESHDHVFPIIQQLQETKLNSEVDKYYQQYLTENKSALIQRSSNSIIRVSDLSNLNNLLETGTDIYQYLHKYASSQ